MLSIQNIGKSYQTYSSEWRRIARWIGFPLKPSKENWILRNISFDIVSNEALGIIGENGSGKSTLLKIIAGTLQPTEGQLQIRGSINSILEMGLGFNHELTGRQNSYNILGLMGLDSKHIKYLLPKVEAFSEINEYFDQPMRIYSTGMHMRVAFSVVTAVRPEILIIDEALSVGDAYFQHKSFRRIREFREQGTALIIVSHDRTAIQSICNKCILIEKGIIIKVGPPEEVFDFYNARIGEKEDNTIEVKKLESGKAQIRHGTGQARFEEVALCDRDGKVVELVGVAEPVELRLRVKVYETIEKLVMGYSIKDQFGQTMYGTNTWHTKQTIDHPNVGDEYQYKIFFPVHLGAGNYSLQIALHKTDTHLIENYDWRDLVLTFEVINRDKPDFIGCSWSEPKINIEKIRSQ